MKKWAAALVVAVVSTTFALAQEPPLISSTQMQQMLKFLDAKGGKETFPAPVALELGLSDDPQKELPITALVTNDHEVYFCRSESDPKDFIIWVRDPDNVSSYMFSTHADFRPVRALYLHTNDFPRAIDVNATEVQAVYKRALAALAKDVDSTRPPKE